MCGRAVETQVVPIADHQVPRTLVESLLNHVRRIFGQSRYWRATSDWRPGVTIGHSVHSHWRSASGRISLCISQALSKLRCLTSRPPVSADLPGHSIARLHVSRIW